MAPAPETPQGQTGLSSRLLTMKFMMRSTATPSSEEPSSKRRKLKNASDDVPSTAALVDAAAVQAALEEQEARRQNALAKHTNEYADTHWVLDAPIPTPNPGPDRASLKVEYVGYAAIDASSGSDEDDLQLPVGRKTTQNYRRPNEKACSIQPSDSARVARPQADGSRLGQGDK